MGLTSIEWTDFTFNPWWGCSKVSAGCANCYAEGVAERFATGNLWGKDAQRKHASDKVWNDPLRWNKAAEKAGRRDLVFCASMADVFEDRSDLEIARESLWQLIRTTPNLRWLLLTKRPENFHFMPPDVASLVALGVSVENQEAADRRIPLLLETKAAIRFVSCEPLLGPVNLTGRFPCPACGGVGWIDMGGYEREWCAGSMCRGLDWVVCGGESGPKARPMHPDWARSLRGQCAAASVPFLFKQWGEWHDPSLANGHTWSGMPDDDSHYTWLDIDGRTQNPSCHGLSEDAYAMARVGKHAAGRLLDGREWLEFPENLREAQP